MRVQRRVLVIGAFLAAAWSLASFSVFSGAYATSPEATLPPPRFVQTLPKAGNLEVDVALVLAVDISYSMDPEELELQRQGYIAALTSKPFIDAVRNGMVGRIAVTYFEWAGAQTQYLVADWEIIEDAASAAAFVAKLGAAPLRRERRTSITGALTYAMARLNAITYRPLRQVIDISGDGPNNDGGMVTKARDLALAAGVTINGLPIVMPRTYLNSYDIDGLDAYYRDCVIGGPGAFLVSITGREQFTNAIRTKILREVAQSGSGASPPVASRGTVDCQIGERMWQRNWQN